MSVQQLAACGRADEDGGNGESGGKMPVTVGGRRRPWSAPRPPPLPAYRQSRNPIAVTGESTNWAIETANTRRLETTLGSGRPSTIRSGTPACSANCLPPSLITSTIIPSAIPTLQLGTFIALYAR